MKDFTFTMECSSSKLTKSFLNAFLVATLLVVNLKAQSFGLTCNGKNVPVYEQNDVPLSFGLDTYKYARVTYKGLPLNIKIEAKDFQFTDDDWDISPHSYGIKGVKKRQQLSFTLTQKGYLVIRFSKDQNFKKRLVIFIEGPEIIPEGKLVDVVQQYGIDNTGQINETAKIQQALDDIASSGNVLYFKNGVYKTSSLKIKSNSHIHLTKHATIKADPEDIESYLATNNKGINRFISITDAENISVTGLGTFNGSGSEILGITLPKIEDKRTKIRLLFILRSKNITFNGIILKDAASWNTHIMGSEEITFKNCKLMNNTMNDDYFGSLDGWDPDASKQVLIEDCFGWAGDDNVAVKCTGYGNLGIYEDVEDITVRRCVFMTKKTALKIGTETRCKQYKNVVFENNDVIEADRVLGVNVRDRAEINGVRFKNIRSEYFYPDRKTMPINIYITRRQENQPWTGKIIDVSIEDCYFERTFPKKIEVRRLQSYTNEKDLQVTFKNLTIEGQKVNTLDPSYFNIPKCNGIIQFK